MITGVSYSLHELHEVPFASLTFIVILFSLICLNKLRVIQVFIIRIYHDARSSDCQNVVQVYVFSECSKRATVLSFPSSLI